MSDIVIESHFQSDICIELSTYNPIQIKEIPDPDRSLEEFMPDLTSSRGLTVFLNSHFVCTLAGEISHWFSKISIKTSIKKPCTDKINMEIDTNYDEKCSFNKH